MSPWLVHSNMGATRRPPLFCWRAGEGQCPRKPIMVDPRCPGFCRREEAMSPGPWSNAVHPCLTMHLMYQKSLFCSTRLSQFVCMFLFHWLQKWLFLQHKTLANFLGLFLIRFAGQNYREISNLHFLSSKRGLCPQMP